MGLHVRVGIEDNLWDRKGERITSVQQVEQMVRISRELHREVASGDDARRIYQIGTQYDTADETLARLGYVHDDPHVWEVLGFGAAATLRSAISSAQTQDTKEK